MQNVVKYLSYNKESGKLYWNGKKKWTKDGQEAGCLALGYVRITVNKKSYPAHHLVWFMHHGNIPNEIDHINHIKDDNRIENLREVSHSVNQKNHKKYKNNSSGQVGVSFHKVIKKWEARIQKKSIGYFVDFKDAVEARKSRDRTRFPL